MRTAGSALKRETRPGQPRLGAPFTNLSICRRRGDYMPGHPGSLFCGSFRTYTGSWTRTLGRPRLWRPSALKTTSWRSCFGLFRRANGAVWAVFGLFGPFSARLVACLLFSSISSSSSVSVCPETSVQPTSTSWRSLGFRSRGWNALDDLG